MKSESINAYRKLASSDAALGYRQLMQFFRDLRTELERAELAPRALHVGEMDFTYIPVATEVLAERKLKVLVMFNHADFQFELWLSGVNKSAQSKWWTLFSEEEWQASELAPDGATEFYLLRRPIVSEPDFTDQAALINSLVAAARQFVDETASFHATQ